MKKLLAIVSLALIACMLFTACGGTPPVETTKAADTTKAPETTKAPVVTKVETTEPETLPELPIPEPEEGKLLLNFDSNYDFQTYIEKAGNGLVFSGDANRSGEIRDYTYYNGGAMCMIEDTTKLIFGGLDTGTPFSYTIAFKIKFEAFVQTDNNTILNIHSYKAPGSISEWNKQICVDIDGRVHINNDKLDDKTKGFQADLDTWYNVKLVMDATTMKASLYINDTDCGSMTYAMSTSTGSCGFRFGNGGGAKFYMDDFTVTKN